MVTDLKDRIGSTICNTQLVGSNSLNKRILKNSTTHGGK